ncbi:MAG: hypothetical protein JOZ96_28730 [Acidobacteria bacterium]|nr:hypothetical protein [Acidobacteriota bacterium]MBV9929033.1 hypothetical protein [Acidobacteriota bacterium]
MKYGAVLIIALLIWAGFDLYAPRRTSLRDFDPDEVARLETAMWRSYYSRQRVKLFREMTELLRTQYRLPLLRSNAVAYRAAKAAFVFKDGHSRADYERALPDLVSFYQSIRAVSDTDFDVERAARLELEWWIVHRERRAHAPGDLDRALADLQAELFRVPADRLAEHARLRAEAMTIRDDKADAGGVNEEDWRRIDELLHQSWRSLHAAVNP